MFFLSKVKNNNKITISHSFVQYFRILQFSAGKDYYCIPSCNYVIN